MREEAFDRLSLTGKLEHIIDTISAAVGERGVMALVSGGKDSTLAVELAVRATLDVRRLVHFTHAWTWDLYADQVEAISERHGIPLERVQFDEDILKQAPEGLIGYVGIPCKFCKRRIFSRFYDDAVPKGTPVIMSGYNRMDDIHAIIRGRLEAGRNAHEVMELNQISKYERDERIFELRPVIRLDDDDILAALGMLGVEVRRTNELNTQFAYRREGCPMQYIDRDVPITVELLDMSKRINERVTAYARELGIRASVFVPSMTVVTEPPGYETAVQKIIEGNHHGG